MQHVEKKFALHLYLLFYIDYKKKSQNKNEHLNHFIRIISVLESLLVFHGIFHPITPFTGNIKVEFGNTKMNFSIARDDIAEFMLKQVKSTNYIYSMPIIGS